MSVPATAFVFTTTLYWNSANNKLKKRDRTDDKYGESMEHSNRCQTYYFFIKSKYAQGFSMEFRFSTRTMKKNRGKPENWKNHFLLKNSLQESRRLLKAQTWQKCTSKHVL